MGRHSNYKENRPRDYWPTVDPSSVKPLIPFVKGLNFYEPCIGDGSLVNLLREGGVNCVGGSDIEPIGEGVKKDATKLTEKDVEGADCFITNPPFSWDMLQPMLESLPKLRPTWLLLPSGFMFNKRSAKYMAKSVV